MLRFGARSIPLCVTGLLLLLSSNAAGQVPVPPEAKAVMEPLVWMIGRWSGEGVYTSRDGRHAVLQTEQIRPALEGALLVVEGTGRERAEDGSPGDVVFRAFGVFSGDDSPGEYRFSAWQGGQFTDARAQLVDAETMTWGFDSPSGGEVRYTIRHPEADVWHETGAFRAADSDEWRPFFEMTLRRDPESGP